MVVLGPPTERMIRILAIVQKYHKRHRQAPSIDEIFDRLGSGSRSSLQATIQRLIRRGLLSRRYGCARSLLLTPAGRYLVETSRLHVTEADLPLWQASKEG